jgi:hypothetical protein
MLRLTDARGRDRRSQHPKAVERYSSAVEEEDEKEPRVSGWVHNHTELVWAALAIVFLIYAATSFFNLAHGVLGPDDSNIIGVFGGVLAAIAGAILCATTVRRKRRVRAEGD